MTKVMLITGAGRGIGAATAKHAAQAGYAVAINYRSDKASAEGVVSDIEASGGRAIAIQADVADEADIVAMFEAVDREFGRLDVLVNNAGIALRGFDGDVARRTVQVNVLGAMAVTDAFRPLLVPPATIVMVSSGMGEMSGWPARRRRELEAPDLTRDRLVALLHELVEDVSDGSYRNEGWPASAYRVSKAALNAFTRILARELGGRGILVNAVCPGWVRTDMGGSGATRSVEEGARGIVWAAMLPEGGPSGKFLRDGAPIPW